MEMGEFYMQNVKMFFASRKWTHFGLLRDCYLGHVANIYAMIMSPHNSHLIMIYEKLLKTYSNYYSMSQAKVIFSFHHLQYCK